ncbi:MAG: hypothetical protein JNM86_14410 [Phycisphaerae bacterium]|nr:hypothetical protein [Phycisphaerae bacterium]
MEAKLIVAIGYSFYDSHINKIVSQAINADAAKKLAIVANIAADKCVEQQTMLARRVLVAPEKVQIIPGTAKSFLANPSLGEMLLKAVPQPESPF